jgi:O-antigen/teichoic acid export membrane protein
MRALAVRGMMYLGGERIGTRVIDQLFTVVLARILVPSHFGTVALATVLTGFVNMFTYMGLGSALIQRKEIDETHLSTAFWANIATGFLMFGIVASVSPFLAAFGNNPMAGIIATALAGRFILAAGSVVQIAQLTRRMDYRAMSIRSILATVVGGVVAVILAYAGAGVWALVGQAIAMTATSTAVLYTATGWRPKFIFSWERFKELFSFGAPILGSRIFGFLIRNVDNLLIGRYLGTQALGFYALGYTIFLAPLADLGLIVNQVLFAALSRVHDETNRLKRGFLDATEFVTMVMLPMMVGLALVARPFVLVFFGEKWLPSAPVISVLAIAGFFRLMVTLGPSGLQAAGRPDLHLQWALLSVLLYLPAFYIGLKWGIVGVALGYFVATLVLVPIQFGFVGRVMKIRATEMLMTVYPAVVGSVVMAAVVWGARTLLAATSVPNFIVLVVLIALGALTYAATVWIVARRAVRRLVRLIREGLLTRGGGRGRAQTPMPQVDPTEA